MFAEAMQPKIFRCSILIKFASCFYFSLVLFVCDGFGPVQNQVCFGHLGFYFGMGPSPAKVAFRVTHIGLWQSPLYRRLVIFELRKRPEKSQCLGAHIGVFDC
jgi:hypothetical protein